MMKPKGRGNLSSFDIEDTVNRLRFHNSLLKNPTHNIFFITMELHNHPSVAKFSDSCPFVFIRGSTINNHTLPDCFLYRIIRLLPPLIMLNIKIGLWVKPTLDISQKYVAIEALSNNK